uniref:SFRICE_011361 n=1 Tax=Spodoptera frugiperda TaxID=7108 RepID=A0A2H1V8J2_SPOFR
MCKLKNEYGDILNELIHPEIEYSGAVDCLAGKLTYNQYEVTAGNIHVHNVTPVSYGVRQIQWNANCYESHIPLSLHQQSSFVTRGVQLVYRLSGLLTEQFLDY